MAWTISLALLRPFLRPALAMFVSLGAGFAASGMFWWLLAFIVPWLIFVTLRFGKYVVIVAVALTIAFFLLDVIAHETDSLDASLDWLGAHASASGSVLALAHGRLCDAWPRLPSALCPMRQAAAAAAAAAILTCEPK